MAGTLRTLGVAALETVTGLVHGFEQRIGPAGWETRDESRRRVAAAVAGSGRLHLLRQVHGVAVHEAPWQGEPEGDAGVAGRPGVLVGIETADCLPLLCVDPEARLAGAAHAGWRGTAAGVARALVRALVARGARPERLVAALGPSIGPCCYEVGEEVRAAFGGGSDGLFRPGPRGRPHLDVRAANRRQLVEEGVPAGALHDVPDCTFCSADLYHSYRREGRDAGRMISFVGWSRR